MSVQLLVSTLENIDYENLLKSLNVRTDAIVINQCNNHSYKKINYGGNSIDIYEFSERGIGLSRNMALMRATAKYCLLSDDDMTYVDDYEELVEKAFSENKSSDVIIFNLNNGGNRYVIKKKFKVNYLNFMRFGAARVAIRLDAVKKHGISFNLCYGGGTPNSAGEDTLFLKDCVKKGLNIVAVPITIATLNDIRESTWFRGYNEKYFIDFGHNNACMTNRFAKLISFLQLIKNRYLTKEYGFIKTYKLMKKGIKDFRDM